jgi:uncharacterized protein
MQIRKPLQIVLPGGSGQVGNVVARYFHERGDSVVVLSRRSLQAPWRVIHWDGVNLGAWTRELEGADVVFNLAGRSVNCRYNAANRREILESRIQSTRIIGRAISLAKQPPRLWINASTATIYRHTLDRPMDEFTGEIGGNEPDAPRAWRFSIDVATMWEECFFQAQTSETRKIALRSAMVMGPDTGGIFDTLLRLVRFGLGGPAGPGNQFVSWVHDVDFVRALEFLIQNEELSGCVNVASPDPLPNSAFMRALRTAWNRRVGLPAPTWMLEIGAIFLRTETELILKSRRVIPGRLLKAGFEFQFPVWPSAAKELVYRWREIRRAPRTIELGRARSSVRRAG